MRKIELTVPDGAAGARLDAWLAGAIADLGRNHAKRLIVDGHVAIGGRTIVEPKRPVKPGEAVVVEVEELVEPGQIDGDHIVTAGIFVNRIVKLDTVDKRIEQRTVRKRV